MDKERSEQQHQFLFSWVKVIQGFWNKYPDQRISAVKFNHTLSLDYINDHTIKAKDLIYFQASYNAYIYNLLINNQINIIQFIGELCLLSQEIEIDLNSEVLQMKSSLIKKINFPFNFNAVETIIYKQLSNGNTHYQKIVLGQSNIKQHLSKLSNSFKTGIEIVEDKIKESFIKH